MRRLIERLSRGAPQAKPAGRCSAHPAQADVAHAGRRAAVKRDRRNWIVLPPFRPNQPFDELAQAAAGVLGADSDWRQWRDALAGENPRKALSDFARDVRAKYGNKRRS